MQLIVWSILLFWKIRLPQVVKKFPTFCGMWRFIKLFTRSHLWSLYWVSLIQFIPSHPVFKIYFVIICLSFPRYSKVSTFFRFSHQNPICTSLLYHPCHTHTYTAPPFILDVTLIMNSDHSFWLYSVLQLLVTSTLLGLNIFLSNSYLGGPRWRSWLRHCATSQKVAGSIPDGVIGIFHWHSPSGRTVALGSTQPLTEMSTGNISWG